MIHQGLEAQEYYTDVIFKTHNVRWTFEVVNDMTIGILGAALYCAIFFLLRLFPLMRLGLVTVCLIRRRSGGVIILLVLGWKG